MGLNLPHIIINPAQKEIGFKQINLETYMEIKD